MENNFNYESVPFIFALCFNQRCVISNNCLHHLAAEHCTPAYPVIHTVNPLRVPEDTETCPYFHSTQKVRMAWGIKHLLDKMPYKEAKLIKSQMLRCFGKPLYYRYYRKEYGLSSEKQEFIRRIFRTTGITEEPVFEYYTEEYVWE